MHLVNEGITAVWSMDSGKLCEYLASDSSSQILVRTSPMCNCQSLISLPHSFILTQETYWCLFYKPKEPGILHCTWTMTSGPQCIYLRSISQHMEYFLWYEFQNSTQHFHNKCESLLPRVASDLITYSLLAAFPSLSPFTTPLPSTLKFTFSRGQTLGVLCPARRHDLWPQLAPSPSTDTPLFQDGLWNGTVWWYRRLRA